MLVESLLNQVMSTHQEIRAMHDLLDLLMATLQNQSKQKLFCSKTSWFQSIDTVRKWKTTLKQIKIPHRVDHHVTLTDLPEELQEKIALSVMHEEDLISLSQVSINFQQICNQVKVWKNLCRMNFKEDQIKAMEISYITSNAGESSQQIQEHDSVEYWRYIYSQLTKHFDKKELEYSDPLFHCNLCSILYWKDSGHPCSRPDESNSRKLTPRQLVLLFE